MSNLETGAPEDDNSSAPVLDESSTLIIEDLTKDLQRVMAEYANYRKRVERDKELGYQNGVADTLFSLVEILDDINLAKTHGEYLGGFQQVGDKLYTKLSNAGLVSYGELGDPFDPNIHEAIAQEYGNDTSSPTISKVLQFGYSFQEKVVRPAVVVIKVPEER